MKFNKIKIKIYNIIPKIMKEILNFNKNNKFNMMIILLRFKKKIILFYINLKQMKTFKL